MSASQKATSKYSRHSCNKMTLELHYDDQLRLLLLKHEACTTKNTQENIQKPSQRHSFPFCDFGHTLRAPTRAFYIISWRFLMVSAIDGVEFLRSFVRSFVCTLTRSHATWLHVRGLFTFSLDEMPAHVRPYSYCVFVHVMSCRVASSTCLNCVRMAFVCVSLCVHQSHLQSSSSKCKSRKKSREKVSDDDDTHSIGQTF